MGELEKVQPLSAFLELQAPYSEPNFAFSAQSSAIISAVFEAFRPWHITLANVSAKQNPANAGEVAVAFGLQNPQLTFSVGVGGATLVAGNPDWSQEQLLSEVANSGLQAVRSVIGVTFRQYVLNLSMHVKPERRSLSEISANFLKVTSPKISISTIKARGFSVYGEDFSWVVDSSVIYTEALFLKIVRTFDANASLPEMARSLRADQAELLAAVQLRIE